MSVATDISVRPGVAGSHGAEPPAASQSAIADVRGGDLVVAARDRLTAAWRAAWMHVCVSGAEGSGKRSVLPPPGIGCGSSPLPSPSESVQL